MIPERFVIQCAIGVSYELCGRNSVVECLLPKQKVASSNLVARSNLPRQQLLRLVGVV